MIGAMKYCLGISRRIDQGPVINQQVTVTIPNITLTRPPSRRPLRSENKFSQRRGDDLMASIEFKLVACQVKNKDIPLSESLLNIDEDDYSEERPQGMCRDNGPRGVYDSIRFRERTDLKGDG